MHAVDVVIAVGWIAFGAYWLVAATGVKAGRAHWRYSGTRVVLALVVLGVLRLRLLRDHPTHARWLAVVGLVLFLLGVGIAIWARVHLGRNWGTPMSQKDEPELVTTGPYRWVRNPIYSGVILAGIGTALAVNVYLLVVVALVGSYFVYSAFMEEHFLEQRLPAQYPPYKHATKRLIPFVF